MDSGGQKYQTRSLVKLIVSLLTATCLVAAFGSRTFGEEKSPSILVRLSNVRTAAINNKMSDSDVIHVKVKGLVGLKKTEIVSALGEPSWECENGKVIGGTKASDVVFSFYSMCNDCLGGGPELSLSFDRDGNCIRAKWYLSE